MEIFSNLFKKQKALDESEEVKKTKIEHTLVSLYTECSEMRENDLINEIKKYKQKEEVEESEIESEIEKIIAKKIASNYSKFGTSNFDIFSTYMPLTRMIEEDIPEIVKNEYAKIKNRERNLTKEEVEKLTKENIIERIAKSIGNEYNTEKTFEIPPAIASLEPEEKDYFINCVHKEVGDEEFSTFQEAILSMKMMKKGTEAAEKTENLIASIQTEKPQDIATIADIGTSMANDSKQLEVHKVVNEIGFEPKTMEVVAKLVDAGVIDNLKKMSEEEQTKSIGVINGELEKVVMAKEKQKEVEAPNNSDDGEIEY